MRIKDLHISERPREKALKYGINSLSSIELLAIIINAGTKNKSALELAATLVYNHHGLANLATLEHPNQMQTPGIGKTKALQILAALTLGKRLHLASKEEAIILNKPEIIYERYVNKFIYQNHESLLILMLDNSYRLLGEKRLYEGTLAGVNLEVREIFRHVLLSGATSFVLLHNHPSNISKPSLKDIEVTHLLKEAAIKMEIDFIDHLIITSETYYSFAENNWAIS
ncbi:MAG: DNA repair protein RadC [Erysipelotrichaceae bacterium]|nr:DNA repair protein RadC [Erysipelotrichaceae bacterium]